VQPELQAVVAQMERVVLALEQLDQPEPQDQLALQDQPVALDKQERRVVRGRVVQRELPAQ